MSEQISSPLRIRRAPVVALQLEQVVLPLVELALAKEGHHFHFQLECVQEQAAAHLRRHDWKEIKKKIAFEFDK